MEGLDRTTSPPLLHISCRRREDPFQGTRAGSCLTLGSELTKETHMLTKRETLLGRGARVESRRAREPRRNCSATWLAVRGFMVMRLDSGSSLATHSDSGAFWVAHASLGQDECQQEGFWEVGRIHGLESPLSF